MSTSYIDSERFYDDIVRYIVGKAEVKSLNRYLHPIILMNNRYSEYDRYQDIEAIIKENEYKYIKEIFGSSFVITQLKTKEEQFIVFCIEKIFCLSKNKRNMLDIVVSVVKYNNLDILKVLYSLDSRIINVSDEYGNTMLKHAVNGKSYDVINFMIQNGVNKC